MAKRHKYHRNHIGKNLLLLVLGILFAFVMSKNETFHEFLLHLGGLGYISAFIGGLLYTSIFTIPTGALIILILAEQFPPLPIAITAGLGGVLGDFTIFHLIRDTLSQDIKIIYKMYGGRHISHVLHTKYFRWTLPVIGAAIIASPLPDELGIGLMTISTMSKAKFILLTFVLNTIGVLLIVSASLVIKP